MLFCPELKEIAQAWPILPAAFKSAVLGIIRSGESAREGQL